jgi:hypothetical protein
MLGNLLASWVLCLDAQIGRRPRAEVHQPLRTRRVAGASSGTPGPVALKCRLHNWIRHLVIDDGEAVVGNVDRCPLLELFPVSGSPRGG